MTAETQQEIQVQRLREFLSQRRKTLSTPLPTFEETVPTPPSYVAKPIKLAWEHDDAREKYSTEDFNFGPELGKRILL
jgi:hypothetical protein